MNWNLEGLYVRGLYMNEHEVSGQVVLSRVKYGGSVSHHIVLDDSLSLFGTVRDRVIITKFSRFSVTVKFN